MKLLRKSETKQKESLRQVVSWGKNQIHFQLLRTQRKTIGITVHPDLGVVVTVPKLAPIEKVLSKVRKRFAWIQKQQRFFEQFLPQTPARRYVSGETHRYLGRQYRLKIAKGDDPRVKLNGRFICVHTSDTTDTRKVRELVDAWYVARARERFAAATLECLARLGNRLSGPPPVRLRQMSKRWGSWTPTGGISLNPELVKAPKTCIDYVVTHELCHAVYGNHGRGFYALLRRVMPDWEVRKARLEKVAADAGTNDRVTVER